MWRPIGRVPIVAHSQDLCQLTLSQLTDQGTTRTALKPCPSDLFRSIIRYWVQYGSVREQTQVQRTSETDVAGWASKSGQVRCTLEEWGLYGRR
jgi:hypothetical protein